MAFEKIYNFFLDDSKKIEMTIQKNFCNIYSPPLINKIKYNIPKQIFLKYNKQCYFNSLNNIKIKYFDINHQ